MGIRDRLSGFGNAVVEELQIATATPEPKSVDDHMATVSGRTVEKHIPDRSKLEDYWEMYENISFIRNPIRSFASEVVSPGYYVKTENEDLKEDLEDWLEDSAIVSGDINRDFRRLLKKATIQREVKGTSLVEKVPDEDGNIYGFKLIRPGTVRALTMPGQTVLMPPDAEIDEDDGIYSIENIYYTEDGDTAAYIQLTADNPQIDHQRRGYVSFTRDQIIKLTRDADAGEVFGTSRLASVEDRLQSLLKKLEDNDKAIESTAHPYMLFKAGTPENPWEPSKVQKLASEHKQSRYKPGLKQFVQGDISIEDYSGEVSDIEPFLNWDLNAIMSDMPMPKYSLGAYESDVNQFVSRSQSARLERQLKDARQEIQDEWTPVLKEKAEEMGYDSDDVEELVIGEDPATLGFNSGGIPEDQDLLPENSEGEATNPQGNNSDTENIGPAGENNTRPPASTEPERRGGGDTNNGGS